MAGIGGCDCTQQGTAKTESLVSAFQSTVAIAKDMIASGNDDLALRYYLLAEEIWSRMPAAEQVRFETALRIN